MTEAVTTVTEADFEREVIEDSRRLPVVVDFWAPWCGPCRALGPMLERIAADYAGRVKFVKVNSDEAPRLSQALNIRSIPDVYAFQEGRPVDHFLGAQPESQIRAFIERLLPTPARVELLRAAELRAAGDAAGAEAALRKSIELAPREDLARIELAELLIAEKRYEEAEALLAAVAPDRSLETRVETLRSMIGFSRASGDDEALLLARASAEPDDLETRERLARLYAGSKRYREAMDQLLEILQRRRDWKDGEARREMLSIFHLAADDPELVSDYRRRLSRTLN
jgi:putative thioredoxin